MSIYSQKQFLNIQIIETQQLLDSVKEHPLMSLSYTYKLQSLKDKLNALPIEFKEPKIKMYFSGDAVVGSVGIKSNFVSNIITQTQEMIKSQVAFNNAGKLGNRGQSRNNKNMELFLTALPTGSFGIELCSLDTNDLFTEKEISTAIIHIMDLIKKYTEEVNFFEDNIAKIPNKIFSNLKSFITFIKKENSFLKMESGTYGIELSKHKITALFNKLSTIIEQEDDIFIEGFFKGLLLNSKKFEFQDLDGKNISGKISLDLKDDILIKYEKDYINIKCKLHLKMYNFKYKEKMIKTENEMLEILPI